MTVLAAGKRAWIVGASSGIGRAVAERLAARGLTVFVSARRAEALQALAADSQGEIIPLPLDVGDGGAVGEALERIERDAGPIDLVVFCAGVWRPMRLEDFSAEALRRTVEINLLGAANLLEALLPGMRARGSGRIALVSSVAGYRGLPMSAAYGASKAALTHMAEALRPECARAGIALQVISPGFVATPMTETNRFPMPFLMDVETAARRILAGLESERFEIHFPRRLSWQLKLLRCLPYPLFFALTRRMLGRRGGRDRGGDAG